MPSPFPGMNPFLEQPEVWPGFHTRFLVRLAESLMPQLGGAYFADVEQVLYVHEDDEDDGDAFARADVSVAIGGGGGTAVLDAPVVAPATAMVPNLLQQPHRHIVIRDRGGRQIVTVLELMSPANKTGRGARQYEEKRDGLLEDGVNFVELDLLRAGQRSPLEPSEACGYRITVARAEDRPHVGVWLLGDRDPLPEIPVPLRPGEKEPTLNLQPLLHETHDAAGYANHLYDRPLPNAEAWVEQTRQRMIGA
jgi:hypothetical protein